MMRTIILTMLLLLIVGSGMSQSDKHPDKDRPKAAETTA